MRCERCGTILTDHSPFCKNCGMRQHDQIEPLHSANASVTARCKYNKLNKRVRREKRIRRAILIISALIVVTVLARGTISFIQEKTMRAIASADDLVTSALAGFIESSGTVSVESREDALSAVYQSALDAVSCGMFESAEQGDNCVVIGLSGGGYYIYMPFDGETEGGASTPGESSSDQSMQSPENTQVLKPSFASSPWNGSTVSADAKLEIVTLQPYCAETKQTDPSIWNYPDLAAETITVGLDIYSFSDNGTADDNNRDDTEVSLDFLKSLSNYSIVIWQGHGVYWKWFGSILGTTETFNMRYFFDFINARVFVTNGLKMAVTSKFFDKYLHKNTNEKTLIYLGNCESGKDPKCRLVDTFLKKGFDCVVANSDKIDRSYNLDMMKAFFEGMSGGTGEFITAQEALDNAKLIYGNYDPYPTGYQAVPVLYGDTTLCFAADESQTLFVSNGNTSAGNATAGNSVVAESPQVPNTAGVSETPTNGAYYFCFAGNEDYEVSPVQGGGVIAVDGGYLAVCDILDEAEIAYDEYNQLMEGKTITKKFGVETCELKWVDTYEEALEFEVMIDGQVGYLKLFSVPTPSTPALLCSEHPGEVWMYMTGETMELFISRDTIISSPFDDFEDMSFDDYLETGCSDEYGGFYADYYYAEVVDGKIMRIETWYGA